MDTRRKKLIKSSVRESIAKLIEKARDAYKKKEPSKSKRYVKMAFDLLKKHKVRLPKELKNSFCRKCCLVWIPDKTVKVTYDSKNDCLRLTCKCGHTKRI
jgi:ribonuclease P protein subunit RPR2